jgi:transcriptional regulator with XRE-family HTH domain
VFEPEELGQRKDDLAAGLRDARRAAGLTGERLAARCGISQSKISKIETGKALATATDVERILTALGTGRDRTAELVALARLANTEFQSVRASLRRGLHHKQRELAALEAVARHVRFFLPLMITGLLQRPEYARASVANFPGDHPQAIARRSGGGPDGAGRSRSAGGRQAAAGPSRSSPGDSPTATGPSWSAPGSLC